MKIKATQLNQKYSTLQVLATAVAAYEHNNHRIERNALTSVEQTIVPNRQLVVNYMQGHGSPFVVTDKHVKQANSILQYLQQSTIMQTLLNRNDRFLTQVNELLLKPTVGLKDFGLMVWAPKLADDYRKKDHVREVSAQFQYTSCYIGKIGDKIETNFTLIDSRYIQSMECHAVYGHDPKGNLIFYWARDEKKICKAGLIRGRVKTHKKDSYRGNACVTTLNYVKIL